MNLQVIASPDGKTIWVSVALADAVHDLTAARICAIIAELVACGLVVLGDNGYLGEEHICVPYHGRNKPATQKDANPAHAVLSELAKHANAQARDLAHPAQAPPLP